MQVTVRIPDELALQAQAQGLTPELYVEKLIAERSGSIPEPIGRAARIADLERFFDEMSRHSDRIPPLPESAFQRESFYRDHDRWLLGTRSIPTSFCASQFAAIPDMN